MSSAGKFYNEHTLCFWTEGPLMLSQLHTVMTKAVEEFTKVVGKKCLPSFQCNLVENKEGEYQKFGYIWVADKMLYHALLGNNVDGTPRVHYVEAKTPSPSKEVASPSKRSSSAASPTRFSWADEEDEEVTSITTPKVKENLPPLLSVGKYEYTQEQRKMLEDPEKPPTTEGKVEFSRAHVYEVAEPLKHNVLFSSLPPNCRLSENDIKAAFEKYGVSPTICIDNGKCYVTFLPTDKQAQFTLLMCKKMKVGTHLLFFGQSKFYPPTKKEKRHRRNQQF